MLWEEVGSSVRVADSGKGNTWRIDGLRGKRERAFLTLLPADGSGLPLTCIRVAKCKSVAEAEVIATCLEHADEFDRPDTIPEMLLDAGFIDLNPISETLAVQIMENIQQGDPERHLYVPGNRLWFGTPDHCWIAVDEHNHFPVYSFTLDLEGDQIVRPDSLLLQPKLWADTTLSPAAAFLFALREIASRRMECRGSHHAALRPGEHTEIVDRIESGEYRHAAASPIA